MDGASKGSSKLHPKDVRPLLQDGTIAAAKIEDNYIIADRDVFDVLFPRLRLTPIEQAVYLQLFRHSYGRGLNAAQLSNSELRRLCNVSHTCIRGALKRLMERGCVKLVRAGVQHEANIYRVLLPSEILNYESATKVKFKPLDVKALSERARRKEPQPEYDGPPVSFDMLRPGM